MPDASVADAVTQLMGADNGIAALADDRGHPAGIITAMDLCVPGRDSAGAAARPVPPAMNWSLTTRTAVREMLRGGAEELATTEDGTPGSRLEAILTASDLALFSGPNPVRLVSAIRRASSAGEIMPLLRQGRKLVLDGLAQPQDVDDCRRIGAEIVSALTDACIRLARGNVLASGIDAPGVPCCWFTFGESARGYLLEPGFPT